MKNSLLVLALFGALALCQAGRAEPISDLLEEATHQEDSLGDLDAAIGLYSQVIANHSENRALVAQALYRRAMCYHKLGKDEQARASLNEILSEYDEQKESARLAERALKKVLGSQLNLLPAPWADNELLHYELVSPAGAQFGTMLVATKRIESKQNSQWRMDTYISVPMGQTFQFARVDADLKTFAAQDSYMSIGQLENYTTTYGENQIVTQHTKGDGETARNATAAGTEVYDYQQLVHLGRRLPLHSKYSAIVSVFYAPTNAIVDASIKVIDEERVKVPYGSFDSYKVTVEFKKSTNQLPSVTAWISKDESRQLLKYESQGNVTVLSEVNKESETNRTVKVEKMGIQFTMPQDWLATDVTGLGNQYDSLLNIFAPRAEGTTMFVARNINTRGSNLVLPSIVQNDVDLLKGYFKQYSVRAKSYSDFIVNGAPARSFIADFVYNNLNLVEYRTYILGPQGIYWFVLRADNDDFEGLKKDYETLVASFIAPQSDEQAMVCNNPKRTNLLKNSDFSQSGSQWISYVQDKVAEAEISFDGGEHAHIKVLDGGRMDWHVQIVQEGVCLEYTKRYRLSFDYASLSTGGDRQFTASVQRTGSGYTNYILPENIDAKTGMQHYEMDFIMSAQSDTNARVLFNFGDEKRHTDFSESQFIIDNVKLVEL